MTDTSQASLSFIPATVFGVTPATPAFRGLRFLSESLVTNAESAVSNEIRSDNIVSEVRRVGMTGSGDIAFELHRNANLEELFAAALRGSWATDVLKGGVLTPHFTFERKIEAGATDHYFRYEGARVGGLTLNVVPEDFVTGMIKVQAALQSTASVIVTGATYPAVVGANGPPMIGVDVSSLAVAGAAGVDYLALTIELDNNLRMQRKIGLAGARGIGYGRRVVTGTLQCYFEDLTAYTLFRNDTSASIVATVTDGTNTFTITIPKIRFTGGEVPNPGNDNDFILTLNWQAVIDGTLATDIQIARA